MGNLEEKDRDYPQEEQPKIKKPYEKPAFRFERVFETRALACGKVTSAQPTCSTSTKTS